MYTGQSVLMDPQEGPFTPAKSKALPMQPGVANEWLKGTQQQSEWEDYTDFMKDMGHSPIGKNFDASKFRRSSNIETSKEGQSKLSLEEEARPAHAANNPTKLGQDLGLGDIDKAAGVKDEPRKEQEKKLTKYSKEEM